jgi:uncharacterized RDD family membrane protein YckC
MMARFDEVELQAVPVDVEGPAADVPPAQEIPKAPILRRAFALLTDLSLFAALTFALMPLVPASRDVLSIVALAGFIVIVSFYYFVGSWMLWRKTVGGTIFDVRVVGEDGDTMPLTAAVTRWAAMWMSVVTCGIGFVIGLPGRLSNTRST